MNKSKLIDPAKARAAIDEALARGKAASERGKAELAKTAALRQKMGVTPRGSGVKLPSGNLTTGGGKPAPTVSSFSSGPIMPTPPSSNMRKGGSVGSASKRADGIASRGKTRGKFV